MKNLFLLFALFLTTQSIVAQTDSVDYEAPKVYTFVEVMPEFPGGDAALVKFLGQTIVYPEMEKDNNIQGKVIVKFVVYDDGSVNDVSIARGVSPGLDKEALRAVKALPNFKPGTQQGKAVRVQYMLPIVFSLQTDAKEEKVIEEKTGRDENFKKALEAMRLQGDYTGAIKHLKKSIKAFPDDYLAYDFLAECYLKTGNKKEACKTNEIAQKKGSPNAVNFTKQNCLK